MKKMTEDNLKSAFAGESQAHMRYLIFAKRSEAEGLLNIARLFRAVSYAEQVHATNHFDVLGMIRGSSENLQARARPSTAKPTRSTRRIPLSTPLPSYSKKMTQ